MTISRVEIEYLAEISKHDFPRTSAAVTQLLAERDAAVAALQKSQAETAAARNWTALSFSKAGAEEIAIEVRALTTPDQTAALDAIVAKAEADGMRKAAEMVWMVCAKTKCAHGSLVSLAVLEVHSAILAAIPKGGAE